MTHFKHHPIKVHYQDLYKAQGIEVQNDVHPLVEDTSEDSTLPQPSPRAQSSPTQPYPKPTYYPSSSESDSEWEEPLTDPVAPLFLTPPPEDHFPEHVNLNEDDLSNFSSGSSTDSSEHEEIVPKTVIYLKQPKHGSADSLRRNDVIAIVKDGCWQRALICSHAGKKTLKNGSLYWNLSGLDEEWKMGCYLFPGQSWGILKGEEINADLNSVIFKGPRLSTGSQETASEEEVA